MSYFGRPAVRDGAVGAVPRADVAEDHEGGRAVLPALADVGAVGFLANGMEVQLPHQLLEPKVLGTSWSTNLQPPRLALRERLYAVATGYLVKRLAHESRGK